ncbi:MAG: class I SAM-dependent methyltransferase [Acidobacteria bacterium]|nr:class I SAM-dependent methyltransferase [Acidobacteriota bacterium]MBI3279997.1 class I SAM-dependent methyltransferase [Acidobacteriota bacterium]
MRLSIVSGGLICVLAAGAAAFQEAQPARSPDVPYVPTPENVVLEMLKMADVKKGDVVYDLGCGDGRIVITAAQKYGVRGVGIDINPERIKEARENADKAGVSHLVQFREADLFTTDISEANVVTLYLLTTVNMKLRPRLWRDLKPGTRVVSHQFEMGDWKAEKEVDLEGHRVLRWTITPALKAAAGKQAAAR